MKTKVFLAVSIVASMLLNNIIIAQSNHPNTNYDVHREYDEDGNLIYYDSTVVTTWKSDTAWHREDSLIASWEANPDSFFRYHHNNPGSIEEYLWNIPSFNWNFDHSEISDIMNDIHENLSRIDIDARIKEMEEIFRELHDDMMEEFNGPQGVIPYNDTIPHEKAKPKNQSYDKATIDI